MESTPVSITWTISNLCLLENILYPILQGRFIAIEITIIYIKTFVSDIATFGISKAKIKYCVIFSIPKIKKKLTNVNEKKAVEIILKLFSLLIKIFFFAKSRTRLVEIPISSNKS